MLLFVLACGLAVTLGLMNFVNLAHGAFAMAGGYVCMVLVNRMGWPFFAALPLAFVSAALIGIVLERLLYRLAQSPHRGRFLLKGALLLNAWNAPVSRPTRDIDLLGYAENDVAVMETMA